MGRCGAEIADDVANSAEHDCGEDRAPGMSKRLLAFDEVADLLPALVLSTDMIAIDGLPLAGKSTLAARLVEEFSLEVMGIDEFVRPEGEWAGARPSYPFPFFRGEEFASAVRALRENGRCYFCPYDWNTGFVSPEPRYVVRDRPVVIEGTGVLDPALVDLFDLRFFVESDGGSLWQARGRRDGDEWAHHWRELFLPSVELYAATTPQTRADLLVKGRGLP